MNAVAPRMALFVHSFVVSSGSFKLPFHPFKFFSYCEQQNEMNLVIDLFPSLSLLLFYISSEVDYKSYPVGSLLKKQTEIYRSYLFRYLAL